MKLWNKIKERMDIFDSLLGIIYKYVIASFWLQIYKYIISLLLTKGLFY